MKVRIDKKLQRLYDLNGLDIEVCLNWILGYLRIEYSKQLDQDTFFFKIDDFIAKDIPDSVINEIRKHFVAGFDPNRAVNILLLNAYLLGGGE